MEVDRKTLMALAGEAELDPRTVTRALENGLSALKARTSRDRLAKAAKKLKVKLPVEKS